MAQIAKTEAGKANEAAAKRASGNVAELTQRATDQVAGQAEAAARRGVHAVEQAAETEREVAQRSGEGTAELGRVLAELASEQVRHNVETLRALSGAVAWDQVAKAVDWQQVLRIQADYLRASMERAARFNRQYVQASQAMMGAAASAAQRSAKKAA